MLHRLAALFHEVVETLMSLVHTLHKRVADPESHLKRVLDQLALNPQLDFVSLLFSPDSS
jgi:hypothetical protein